jgi:GT2 family glycosyltransferase
MNLTVVIKTFLRPACCVASVESWLLSVPGIPIVVVDDGGDVSPDLTAYPTVRHIKTDFDIGISEGRNIGVEAADTRYVLLADDDNGCSLQSDVPAALEQLQAEGLAVLGVGAYRLRDADGCLYISGRPRVEEFTRCDATLNHFVGDRDSMPRWDPLIKIGGEHADYFLEARRIGAAVGATPLLSYYRTWAASRSKDPRYGKFRNRVYMRRVREKWGYRAISRWRVEGAEADRTASAPCP